MKFQVQIYAKDGSDFTLLDLFQDETIEIKSSVQDIKDISMVFTDFSQTFTIPASKTNNQVFKYYYNNDLNEFNANVRIDARVEINRAPFRRGQIQLESAEIVDGQVQSYKISFYGDIVTLKDLIGNDKLKDLNYATVATNYNGSTVQSSIISASDLNVRFPLISSERLWTYTGGGADDITQGATPMEWTELFPALKDVKILDLIEAKYGVQFVGNFLTDKRFTNSFTWWKNRETTSGFLSQPFDVTFDFSGIADSNSPTYPMLDTANEINILGFNFNLLGATNPITDSSLSVNIQVYNLSNSDPYSIDVYKNGVFYNSFSPSVGQLTTVVSEPTVGTSAFLSIDDDYTFKVRTTGSATFDYEIQYIFSYTETAWSPFPIGSTQTVTTEDYVVSGSGSTTSNFDFNSTAPDIQITEWLSGTLKQFNLTCYPTDTPLQFKIEPLMEWYAAGDDVDITAHVDTDSIEVSRPKLYNEINFGWQESKSFMNESYKETNERQYGSLSEKFPFYDGGKYDIKLPFETLLFANVDTVNGNLQLGYSLTKAPDYKPYIPKPVKLYLQDNFAPAYFRFNNGSATVNITNYLPFGQEVRHNNKDYTINFGSEFSTLDNTPKNDSLYNTYYKPYLVNLFNSKTRIVTVKEKLPISILTKLSLDDAIIIRDKKYRINDLTTDLTTGFTKMVLITDFVGQAQRLLPYVVPSSGGDIVVPVKPTNGGYLDIDIIGGTGYTSSSPSVPATREGEQNWKITAPSNSSGVDRQDVYQVTGINPDGSTAFERIYIFAQEDSSFYLLTEDGGYLLQENLGRIKL